MASLKIAVIGAGSSYTPEIIEGFVQEVDSLPVQEIALMDIDPERLEVVAGFCRRFLNHLGRDDISLTMHASREPAISGAQFIVVQMRVGGNRQRVVDEKIPLKYGVIGQETTGPGGMLKAFRTIPVMVSLAEDVVRINPQAWIINYTNPTGLITEAVTRYTRARITGLCAGGLFPRWIAARALSVPPESVEYDYAGLNHLSFASNFRVNGQNITDEEFDRVARATARGGVDLEIIRALKLIPSPYLQYYFHTARKITEVHQAGRTRGEEVLELEEEVFRSYADPLVHTKPEALKRRGGGGYSQVALAAMKAIYQDLDQTVITNVPNQGAIKCLPDSAVVEIPCRINASGITPLPVGELPAAVRGLIIAVKNYEQLAVEAAVSGSREKAMLALLAHPLVRDAGIARPLLAEMLAANQAYLPQFNR